MSGQNGATMRMLTGEAMWPDRIERRWPGAQFVARAKFDAGDVARPAAFETLTAPATWGILVRIPADETAGLPITAQTDRGESVEARFDPEELLAGDPESVVAAARYWELPWRYVAALKDAVAAQGIEILDEEPRDDAVAEANGSA